MRDVNAWKLAGEEFAVGDLIVGNVPPSGEGLRAAVEPHVTADAVAMFVELYSTAAATWDGANVTFELADDENAPALATLNGRLATGRQPTIDSNNFEMSLTTKRTSSWLRNRSWRRNCNDSARCWKTSAHAP